MASPATHAAARPSGWIDPRRPGDYPIILGESLKGDSKARDALLGIRYNWQPKAGFESRESKLEKSGDKYQLLIPDGDSDEYKYIGLSNSPDDASTSFALVYNRSKPVPTFVLESLSTRLDLNLRSAPSLSSKEARNLPQLPEGETSSTKAGQSNTDKGTSPGPDDDTPDPSNPYDFRHFLNEAREISEKASLQSGSRTPIPGSRTPMSGVSTPIPGAQGASRGQATTPQFRPTHASKPTPPQRKKKSEEMSRGPIRPSPAKPAARRDATKGGSSQPLSKERISDSDEDDDDEQPYTRPASKPSALTSHDTGKSRPSHLNGKGHARNASANIGMSPHIIINDDDLEIDMGSPPPESGPRRGRVDPEMFRSHTGTPIAGLSSNMQSKSASRPMDEARSRGKDKDADVTMRDIEAASSDDDEDGDVEEFELGSPRDKRLSVPHSGSVSRMEEDDDNEDEDNNEDDHHARRPRQSRHEHAPTPPAPVNTYDDDDDLEAALEAALEEEDEDEGGGIGLGIGVATQDDESEVSEEE